MIELNTPIRGPIDLTADVLRTAILTATGGKGLCYSDAELRRFCAATVMHSRGTGIRTSIVAGQMMKETNWLRYGGQVQCGSHNYAGIGATNDGAAGVRATSIEIGVAMVFAHHLNYLLGPFGDWPADLRAYQVYAVRNSAVVSAGYGGAVRAIGDLTNGRWAWSPQYPIGSLENGYATGIVAIGNALLAASAAGGTATVTPKIVDLRDRLPKAPGQGSGVRFAGKRGQVLHYSAVNYPDSIDMVQLLIAEAQYHITNSRLLEYSLAYHWAVDWRDGTLYLTRDEDAVLWHCAYWGTPGNQDGIAVHVPGGGALRMSERAVQSLLWLFARNEQKYGFGRAALKGHLELSSTDCPGPLMDQIVRPYRAGILTYQGGDTVTPSGDSADAIERAVTIKDEVTGHTVHPELADIYDLATHGRPLQPAVLYSDGTIRQLFERACLGVGANGKPDTIEGLGQALLYMAGDHYPEWPTAKPLVG